MRNKNYNFVALILFAIKCNFFVVAVVGCLIVVWFCVVAFYIATVSYLLKDGFVSYPCILVLCNFHLYGKFLHLHNCFVF